MQPFRFTARIVVWAFLAAALAWVAAAIYLGEITLRLPRKTRMARQGLAQDAEITAADGVKLRGWFFPAAQPARGTVILLHGQVDNRMGMLGFANLFVRHGYNALTPDIRAHGASGGALATYGYLEAADLQRWVDWVVAAQPGRPIFGFGESMGAAILLQSLKIESRFCALVVEAPYATFRDIAYDRLSQRWGKGPGRYLLRPTLELSLIYERLRYGIDLSHVSPAQAVAASRTPVLLIFGTYDDNTPARHARAIHDSNPAAVTPWEIPNAAHTGAWGTRPREFEQRVPGWFDAHPCH